MAVKNHAKIRVQRLQSSRHWKSIVFNGLTLLTSVLVSLAFAEGILASLGKYDELVHNRLVPSTAIWEEPRSGSDNIGHPDILTTIESRFDVDGVRNPDPIPTSKKENIIGFFGDSYTANRRIRDDLKFTAILQNEIVEKGWNIVNFGVAGYGVDQAYIRYEKYATLDLVHAIFVFFQNDFDNLYETGLVHLENSTIRFQKPSPFTWRRFLGRFRLTYFAIDSYLSILEAIYFGGIGAAFEATAGAGGLSKLAGPTGSSVSVVTIGGGQQLVQISGVDASTPSHGKPGIHLRVPDAIESAVSGAAVKVTVTARKPPGSTNHAFAVAYSTNDVGNSGWRRFDLSDELQPYSFTYEVDTKKTGHGDFVGFLPDPDGGNGAVQIAAIAVEPFGSSDASVLHQIVVGKPDLEAEKAARFSRLEETRGCPRYSACPPSSPSGRAGNSLADEFLSESPSVRATEIAAAFTGVLDYWQQAAAARGQAFTIVVLPYQKTVALAKKMGFERRFDTVYLSDLMGMCGEECGFENDGHWNEFTNVRAAVALARTSQMAPYLQRGLNLANVVNRYDATIRAFYQRYEKH